MFAYRHDILKALIGDGLRLVVLGKDERIADLPEYQSLKVFIGFDALSRMLHYAPESKLLVVGQEERNGQPE